MPSQDTAKYTSSEANIFLYPLLGPGRIYVSLLYFSCIGMYLDLADLLLNTFPRETCGTVEVQAISFCLELLMVVTSHLGKNINSTYSILNGIGKNAGRSKISY